MPPIFFDVVALLPFAVAIQTAQATEPFAPIGAKPVSATAASTASNLAGSAGNTGASSSPPYVAPFQLRNVMSRTGVRLDTTAAPYDAGGADALTTVLLLGAQVRLADAVSLQARWGVDDNRVGTGQRNRAGILNPSLGALFAVPVGPNFRFAVSAALSLPLATGGGENPDPDALFLQRQGALARSAMDNASFAVNDLGVPTGMSLAYIRSGFTAQADFTIIASGRVKGPKSLTDSTKLNSTYGLMLGYFVVPELSLGIELRYQYYLTITEAILRDPSARDNLTLGTGARLHIDLSATTRMRPGLCYAIGLHGPVREAAMHMVQFDIPISF